jgi:hypothetical protein
MVETMTVNEKILKTLKNVNGYIEKTMVALNNKDENLFADSLWRVAAELEYALFLFSITLQNENNIAHWKQNPKKMDVTPSVGEVQSLLNEAMSFVEDGKLLEAYKNVYVARHSTLKIQEELAKRKREALKKK